MLPGEPALTRVQPFALAIVLVASPAFAQQHWRGAVEEYIPAPELEPLSISSVTPTSTLELRVEAPLKYAQAPVVPPCWLGGAIPTGYGSCLDHDGTIQTRVPGDVPQPLGTFTKVAKAKEPDPAAKWEVTVGGGAVASWQSDDQAVSYSAHVGVSGPLPLGGYTGVRFGVDVDIAMLPGEGSIEKVDTYQSLEVTAELSQRISKVVQAGDSHAWTSVYASTTLGALKQKDDNPLPEGKKSPVSIEGGLKLEVPRYGDLYLGLVATKVFDGEYQPAAGIRGEVKLPDKITRGVDARLVIRVMQAFVNYGGGAARFAQAGLRIGFS